jgi:hypothetical protein
MNVGTDVIESPYARKGGDQAGGLQQVDLHRLGRSGFDCFARLLVAPDQPANVQALTRKLSDDGAPSLSMSSGDGDHLE